jgi:hypothetical protein
MKNGELKQKLNLPDGSSLTRDDYIRFLRESHDLLRRYPQYLSGSEGINSLELAHLLVEVPETVLCIYIGINDAACNKGLLTPFLPRHAHNNVFVFDPHIYPGGNAVPSGTADASVEINGFEPPNDTWDRKWTYVMIEDPGRSFASLWEEKGYIDMIPAKFEDFTMLSDSSKSRLCTFIDRGAFDHPVNRNREYLVKARERGERQAADFITPEAIRGETEGLVPVMLDQGEKLYVARADFQPCEHCWSNLHPENEELSVVNENSAVPLDLVQSKPPVQARYRDFLVPSAGSADFTTDRFFRGREIFRKPIKQGHIAG